MGVLERIMAVGCPRPTHAEFTEYLDYTGHTVSSFSEDYNYNQDDVRSWIERKRPIPRFVMVIINDHENPLG